MNRLLLLASLIGLFMYAGFVMDRGQAQSIRDLAGLEMALQETKTELRSALITGWVAAPDAKAQAALSQAFGWSDSPSSPGEVRELRRYERDGVEYIGYRWVIPSPAGWQRKQRAVQQGIASLSPQHSITVQLEGVSPRSDLSTLIAEALEALDATRLQPWSGPYAASLAGQSPRLPDSPFGVNVQIAARRAQGSHQTRVWIAWPALSQEY